ncbi:hypothetical protein [Bosea sp. 47.2.35]|uniref:hypothetical protein n=1 Tax=Bosea sp. 47.2.35 TaxID=2969304 RepID=UPI00215032F1|nr:hypothetical protein [Bosea sp. 47.2.35]MCR4524124.1 hypothetical protein [Bosea sp. 47.2.35]
MDKWITVAALCLASTNAGAFTEVGKFGGYGFVVMKTLSVDKRTPTYSGHIQGIRVGERGDVTKYEIRIECANPGSIHIEEDGNYKLLTWAARDNAVRAKPMNAGYYSIYDKFCPPKSRGVQKSAKCMMTDNGKLCGNALRTYQMND